MVRAARSAGPEAADQEQVGFADAEYAATPLDVLLADAALGTWRRFFVGASGARLGINLARRPGAVFRRGAELAAEMNRIVFGTSELAPKHRDRRFTDPAWQQNGLLRRLLQAYLATSAASQALLADAELDSETEQKISFVVDNLIEAGAPSNLPLINPSALKASVDSGGTSYLRGVRNLLRDLSSPPRVPSMVDPRAYRVGTDLALTPGAVVLRTELLEVIQYTPQTDKVGAVPLLIVPPMINKFYVMDLAPGRSLVEYLVREGIQVFMVSWRNPEPQHRDWGFDTYGQGILDALDAVERITGGDRTVLFGACSGGIAAAMTASHLAETGVLNRLAGLTLVVTVLDQASAGLASAVLDDRTVRLAKAVSARKGYLDGRTLAEVFAWLRPGDLIWNYWVNNYLLGNPPPAFDILAWNADVTRMPARLHHDFLDLGVGNTLVTPGKQQFLGTPVDLSAADVDAYVVAGVADHLCDWRSCYATPALLGGKTRFVLSTSGHIAAIVNPPGNPKAKYQVSDDNPAASEEYLKAAGVHAGTWWTDYADWLRAHGDGQVPAPRELGGGGLTPLGPAPGEYVLDR
jgi:poly[(R)-3-hydroxyalkanoate] polymerase subunit PhaC